MLNIPNSVILIPIHVVLHHSRVILISDSKPLGLLAQAAYILYILCIRQFWTFESQEK